MDLVGNSTPVIEKLKFVAKPNDRLESMMEYLRNTPQVRDVVVSGGDVANMPWTASRPRLTSVTEIENIRDIRLATKALIGSPPALAAGRRHRRDGAGLVDGAGAWGVHRDPRARQPRELGHAARGSRCAHHAGHRHPRRTQPGRHPQRRRRRPARLFDLCFALLDGAQIMPYYFYMCDMIRSRSTGGSRSRTPRSPARDHRLPPGSRRRASSATSRSSASAGCARSPTTTPARHLLWTRTPPSIEATDPEALSPTSSTRPDPHPPAAGQEWWQRQATSTSPTLKAAEVAEASRRTAALQAYSR